MALVAPEVDTMYPVGIGETWVELRGFVFDIGEGQSKYVIFEWGTTDEYGEYSGYLWVNATGIYQVSITTLTGGQEYHYRIDSVATDGENEEWNYGGDVEFHTPAASPPATENEIWVEGNNFCYIDSSGYKRVLRGEKW